MNFGLCAYVIAMTIRNSLKYIDSNIKCFYARTATPNVWALKVRLFEQLLYTSSTQKHQLNFVGVSF